jgi:hypothetical protein
VGESEQIATTMLKQQGYKRSWITCDYSSAIVMRIYENGDVKSMSFDGEEMDALCKAWQEYRQKQEGGE